MYCEKTIMPDDLTNQPGDSILQEKKASVRSVDSDKRNRKRRSASSGRNDAGSVSAGSSNFGGGGNSSTDEYGRGGAAAASVTADGDTSDSKRPAMTAEEKAEERRRIEAKRAYNRMNAARARKRTKDQIQDLTDKVNAMNDKNARLETDNSALEHKFATLQEENQMLRTILARGRASNVPAGAAMISGQPHASGIDIGMGAGAGTGSVASAILRMAGGSNSPAARQPNAGLLGASSRLAGIETNTNNAVGTANRSGSSANAIQRLAAELGLNPSALLGGVFGGGGAGGGIGGGLSSALPLNVTGSGGAVAGEARGSPVHSLPLALGGGAGLRGGTGVDVNLLGRGSMGGSGTVGFTSRLTAQQQANASTSSRSLQDQAVSNISPSLYTAILSSDNRSAGSFTEQLLLARAAQNASTRVGGGSGSGDNTGLPLELQQLLRRSASGTHSTSQNPLASYLGNLPRGSGDRTAAAAAAAPAPSLSSTTSQLRAAVAQHADVGGRTNASQHQQQQQPTQEEQDAFLASLLGRKDR